MEAYKRGKGWRGQDGGARLISVPTSRAQRHQHEGRKRDANCNMIINLILAVEFDLCAELVSCIWS